MHQISAFRRLFPRNREDRLWIVAVVLCSALFAFACVLPHVLQVRDAQYPYQGIAIMPTDQEFYYAARVREVADGFWSVGNAYRETKDTPGLQPAFPEWTIAMAGRIFGFDPVTAFLLSRIVLGFLVSFLFIGLFTALTRRKWEVLLAVAFLLFAGSILGSPWNIMSMLFDVHAHDWLRFARPVNPQWSSAWFLLAVWLLHAWLTHRKAWQMPLIAMCTAVMLYSYVYAWTFMGVVLVCVFVQCALNKDTKRLLDFVWFGFIFFLLALPYAFHMHELVNNSLYAETAVRQGLVERRLPVFGVWATVLVLLIPFRKWLMPAGFGLVPAFAVAGIVTLNQQLITGQYLVPHHYHWYFVQPLASLFLVTGFFSLVSLYLPKKWSVALGSLLMLFFVAFGFVQQQRGYNDSAKYWGQLQQYAPVMQAIRQQGIGPRQVIFISNQSPILPDLTAVYTAADVYFAGNANGFLTSDARARNSYFMDLWLQGVTPEQAEKEFPTTRRFMLSSRVHSIYYRELLDDYSAIPDVEVAASIQAYKDFFALTTDEKIALHPMQFALFTPLDTKTDAWTDLLNHSNVLFQENGYVLAKIVTR
ncbi:MAG: hypothetical protein KBD00_03110 [Candidatus Peribacteraceae bacterium]|nr:hypothetical protein [Candidatus Peribacteraceae bacterium]